MKYLKKQVWSNMWRYVAYNGGETFQEHVTDDIYFAVSKSTIQIMIPPHESTLEVIEYATRKKTK